LEVQGLRPWFERFGDRSPTLINMYGITETTVHVTYRPLSLADLEQAAGSPIGEPIVDLSWYLLDDALNLTPPGCIGELYVAGAGAHRPAGLAQAAPGRLHGARAPDAPGSLAPHGQRQARPQGPAGCRYGVVATRLCRAAQPPRTATGRHLERAAEGRAGGLE